MRNKTMDNERKHIEELIQRFMDGESTLDEERYLGRWLRDHDVDDSLRPYQRMFAFFDEGMPLKTEATAPARRRTWWWRAAAAAIVAAAIASATMLLTSRSTTAGLQQAPIAISQPIDTVSVIERQALPAEHPVEQSAPKVKPKPRSRTATQHFHHAATTMSHDDSAEVARTIATLELAESEYIAEQIELERQLIQVRQNDPMQQVGWVNVSLPCQ